MLTRVLFLDIDGGQYVGSFLYELDCPLAKVQELLREYRKVEDAAAEFGPEAFDELLPFDVWVNEHPDYTVNCTELQYEILDGITAEPIP
jgi:hypothetical protein